MGKRFQRKTAVWISAAAAALSGVAGVAVLTAANLLILVSIISSELTGWPFRVIVVSIGSSQLVGMAVLKRQLSSANSLTAADPSSVAIDQWQQQVAEFEEFRSRSMALLKEQTLRLNERERRLAERLTRVHEVLEYPIDDPHQSMSADNIVRLSEQDREVNRILESEAERVYEKIRVNAYMVDGRLSVTMVRDELHQLVRRIAQVYSPDSTNPLLETSFEQLARAASRICLHMLVLMEQLPLNVQQYNFNNLYTWLRTAVQGYGAYKSAAPWLKYLTRGMYAGRMLSAASPATMGAWWLASEVGRKGAQKLMENMIDRQAVAVLHDMVTVIGVEVACIYGTGFRQRDAAWQLGAELVELIGQFPLSRESLREGLKQITALPLRNEYDRIYLYRCLATHRSTRQKLPDPAVLTRTERERIAAALEKFFTAHIHGVTAAQINKWRNGFEERFDLRLNLSSGHTPASQLELTCSGLLSLAAFLTAAAGLSPGQAILLSQRGRLAGMLTDAERTEFFAQLEETLRDRQFEPPNLEPVSPLTDAFLHDLAQVIVLLSSELDLSADAHLEQLVMETGGYFRRTGESMQGLLNMCWIQTLRELTADPAQAGSSVDARMARVILAERTAGEQMAFCYQEVSLRVNSSHLEPLPHACVVGFQNAAANERRTLLLSLTEEGRLIWCCGGRLSIDRESGILIDSAAISGGTWHQIPVSSTPQSLVIAGSVRGGRFSSYFRPLLRFAN